MPQTKDVSIKESYTVLKEQTSSDPSAQADVRDERDRGWTKLIRGEQNYRRFHDLQKDQVREFYLVRAGRSGVDARDFLGDGFYKMSTQEILNRDGGISPGVLSVEETVPELLWKEELRQDSMEACNDDFLNAVIGKRNGGMPTPKDRLKAQTFCSCSYEEAARRWTFEEFHANQPRYEKIIEETIDPVCVKRAEVEQL